MIALRCDAGPRYGFGHLMRCLSLAQALRSLGGPEPVFLVRELGCRELYEGLLGAEGFETRFLPERAAGFDFDPHLAGMDGPGHVAVFDNYEVTPGQMAALRHGGTAVVAVDDLADRRMEADLVVNQNLGAADLVYDAPAGTRLFLGPRYTMVRQSFQAVRLARASAGPHGRERPEVFVSFGGGDVFSRVRPLIEHLGSLWRTMARPPRLSVALPDQAGGGAALRREFASQGLSEVRWITGELDLSGVMSQADLALTAGGSSVFELACLGVPMAVVCIDANQMPTAGRIEREGIGLFLGTAWEVTGQAFTSAVAGLLENQAARRTMSERAAALVDGQGARRVAAEIAALHASQRSQA